MFFFVHFEENSNVSFSFKVQSYKKKVYALAP